VNKTSSTQFSIQSKLLLTGLGISTFTAAGIFSGVLLLKATTGEKTPPETLGNLLILSAVMILVSCLITRRIGKAMTSRLEAIGLATQLLKEGRLEELTQKNQAFGEVPIAGQLKRMQQGSDDEIDRLAGDLQRMIQNQLELAKSGEQLALGNTNVEIIPQSERDLLGCAMQGMARTIQKLTNGMIGSETVIKEASSQLTNATEQSKYATSQIATTIQQIAIGTNQQAESLSKTALSIHQMSSAIQEVANGAQEQSAAVEKVSAFTTQINKTIQQVAGNAKAVTEGSARAAEAARNGSMTVEKTLEGMSNIRTKVGMSAAKVREMGSRSTQIGAIVETIENIASQTNLLALNAAIEAARAGTNGKGFAVVADEVRRLAERASKATKEIGEIIKGIQQTVAEAVDAMNEGSQEVETGVSLANEAGKALVSILDASETVFTRAQGTVGATQQVMAESSDLVLAINTVSSVVEKNTAATTAMAANANEVKQAVEMIASVSEQNSAAVEEVAASIEEISTQIDALNSFAQTLMKMGKNK
jgi:methyl-accepting chemotaxis protein